MLANYDTEKTPLNSAELRIQGHASRAEDAYTILKQAVREASSFSGQSFRTPLELSTDLCEMIAVADQNQDQYKHMSEAVMTTHVVGEDPQWTVSNSQGILQQYIQYFNKEFKDEKDVAGKIADDLRVIDSFVEKGGKEKADVPRFIDHLMEVHPVMGLATAHLYKAAITARNGESKGLKYEDWYAKSVEKAASSHGKMERFFGKIESNMGESENRGVAAAFVNDWKNEVQLMNTELLSLANGMAIHVQIDEFEDCGVFVGSLPLPLRDVPKPAAFDKVQGLFESEVGGDEATVFESYSSHVRKFNEIMRQSPQGSVFVPIYVSVVDLRDGLNYLDRYWGMLNDGLKPSLVRSHSFDERHSIDLGNAASILIREQGTSSAQARIAVRGKSSLAGFNIRLDKDERYKTVACDIGSTNFQDGVAYAEHLKQQDAEGRNIVTGYAQVADGNGKLKLSPNRFYPSAFQFFRQSEPKREGVGVSMMAGIAMRTGRDMGLRQNHFHSYHSSEYVNKPEYYDNFASIAALLRQSLTNAI